MPSAKSHRSQLNKFKSNLSIRTEIKSSVTSLRASVENNDDSTVTSELFNNAAKILYRAAKKNVIHKNNASRRKSRLQKIINKSK